MRFEGFRVVIYCEDEHYNEYDNNTFYYDINTRLYYYAGHLIHKDGGPAIEYASGGKHWCLHGEEYSESKYKEIMSLKKKRKILDEI